MRTSFPVNSKENKSKNCENNPIIKNIRKRNKNKLYHYLFPEIVGLIRNLIKFLKLSLKQIINNFLYHLNN